MVTRFEEVLPVEQWQQILKNVPPGSLCRVATTSKYMNGLVSWPKLWTDMWVNVRKVRDDGLANFYSIDRFKKVTKINFSNVKFTKEQLERLLNDMDGSPLEKIKFWGTDFREVPAEVLARAVGQLKTFKLLIRSDNLQLTTDQCVKVLEAIVSSTTLVNVKLEDESFFEVPAELLASAVIRLQKVNLSYLTSDQCIRVLEASLSSTTLVKVDLSEADLSGVPTHILVNAACRLRTFKLREPDLTADQSLHLLEGMGSSSTLVNVDLEGIDLSGVPAWMLSKAVCRLENVNLSATELTTSQSIELLKSILKSETLKKLNLSSVDLKEVPSELISRVVCRLSAVDLGEDIFGEHYGEFQSDGLTILQCVQILEAIPTSSKLVELSLVSDLSAVSAEILTDAIRGLQFVNLSGASLTTGQCVAFLEATLASKEIVKVYLAAVNLSGVPPELLVRVVRKLKILHLDDTQLTTDQCVEVVDALISSPTVCRTNLYGNQITDKVPADKLASLPPHVYGEHNDD